MVETVRDGAGVCVLAEGKGEDPELVSDHWEPVSSVLVLQTSLQLHLHVAWQHVVLKLSSCSF